MKKSGQVTIFIIIGIVVVAFAVLAYIFYPEIKTTLTGSSDNPSAFLQNCLEEKIENTISDLSLKGGSLNPEHYFVYDNSNIEYLCYTGNYYETCVVQQPMLKRHIESEIEKGIENEAQSCFDSLKLSFENKGYNVELRKGAMKVELLPKRVVVTFNNSLTTSGQDSEEYDKFEVILNNNLYELVSIANSILNWESQYGDSETTIYMNYYHDLKVEKKKQSDGTTIYILTDRNNGNKFQFASRSVAWPPGYGAGGVV